MDQFSAHAASTLADVDTSQIPDDIRIVLEQQVTDGEAVVDRYHVIVADGSVRVDQDPAEGADVILRQDVATAQALREGSLHAQQAFLTGRLSIEGDIDGLLEHGPLLAILLSATSDV